MKSVSVIRRALGRLEGFMDYVAKDARTFQHPSTAQRLQAAIKQLEEARIPPKFKQTAGYRDQVLAKARDLLSTWEEMAVSSPTEVRLKLLARAWTQIAEEPVRVIQIGTSIYGLGSELAVSRLARTFRNGEAEYSSTLGWRFVIRS